MKFFKASPADRIGVAVGLRIYPGTALARMVEQPRLASGVSGADDPGASRFFIEPAVSAFIFSLIGDLTADDGRFLFFDPSRPDQNYNYNANERLVEAIRSGHRGAYWDILRKISS